MLKCLISKIYTKKQKQNTDVRRFCPTYMGTWFGLALSTTRSANLASQELLTIFFYGNIHSTKLTASMENYKTFDSLTFSLQ